MELEILLIFDREHFWRRAKLDLDSLPSSAAEMPESISGTIMWVDGDMFLIDQSKKKRAIFNQTQVVYDFELSDRGSLKA
jgi:hypothetical protein